MVVVLVAIDILQTPCATGSACGSLPPVTSTQHAMRWPGTTGSRVGFSGTQRSIAYGQRGWNGQPGGGSIRSGGRPSIGTSFSLRGSSSRGIDFNKPSVYGCRGL